MLSQIGTTYTKCQPLLTFTGCAKEKIDNAYIKCREAEDPLLRDRVEGREIAYLSLFDACGMAGIMMACMETARRLKEFNLDEFPAALRAKLLG